MRALRCRQYGPIDGLVVEEIEALAPGEGEVVVDIVAASVNFPDFLIVSNQYQVKIPVPFTPGSEFAGVVSMLGPGVMGQSVGDRVMGASQVGAFAQQICIPASSLRHVPPAVDFVSAAAFGITYKTAYFGLRTIADIRPGEWLVVLGAAGGVGLAAVELGKILGARVIAAASSSAKLEACCDRGADAGINYLEEDLKVRIRELTAGGADVVLDPVGGALSEQALRAMTYGGRFVCAGFASGEIPRIPLNLVLLKGPLIMGITIEGVQQHRAAEAAGHDEELWQMFTNGLVRPHIGGVFSLDRAREALAEVGERRSIGKVIIEMDGV